jgi:hypothetical protein
MSTCPTYFECVMFSLILIGSLIATEVIVRWRGP